MKSFLSALLLVLGLCVGTYAECNKDIDDVFGVCSPNFEEDFHALFDGFDENTNETVACLAVYEFLDNIATCLSTNDTFDACTTEEMDILENEIFEIYNVSCVYHDECLLDYDIVVQNLTDCFMLFNDSLHTAFDNLVGDDPDFTTACDEFHSGLEAVGPCFEAALEGHWCSEEAIYNLTIFYYEFDSYYNDTCGNDYFDEEILTYCDDTLYAFEGLAYCFGYYLYDYDGYSFDDYGYQTDIILSNDECEEVYEYIYDTALCAGHVIDMAGCNDDVGEVLLDLLLNTTSGFEDVCGEDSLDDLRLGSTAGAVADTTSAAGLPHIHTLSLLIAVFMAIWSKMVQ